MLIITSLKALGSLGLKIYYNVVSKHSPKCISVGHSYMAVWPVVSNCSHHYSENLGLTYATQAIRHKEREAQLTTPGASWHNTLKVTNQGREQFLECWDPPVQVYFMCIDHWVCPKTNSERSVHAHASKRGRQAIIVMGQMVEKQVNWRRRQSLRIGRFQSTGKKFRVSKWNNLEIYYTA